MQGGRGKDISDAVREELKKWGLPPEDVEVAVDWAKRGVRPGKLLKKGLVLPENSGGEGSIFGLSEAEIENHPCNGKRGIWRVNGIRHSCLVTGVSTAREALQKAFGEGAVHEWELCEVSFLGEALPEVFPF